MNTNFNQDIPPEGGFGMINVERVVPKRIVPNKAIFIVFIASAFSSYFSNKKYRQRKLFDSVIENDSYIAMIPFITAEKDRNFLKAIYLNREEEKKLMKNVPGWKVNTYFGEPIFKTLPKNKLGDIDGTLYFAHRSFQDYKDGLRLDHDI